MTCSNPVTAVVCDGDVAVAALTCCEVDVVDPPDPEVVLFVAHRRLGEEAYRALVPLNMQSPLYNPTNPGGPLPVPNTPIPTDIDPPTPGGGSQNHHGAYEVPL